MKTIVLLLVTVFIKTSLCIYNPSEVTKGPAQATWKRKAKTPQEVQMHQGYSKVAISRPEESQHVQRIWPQTENDYEKIFDMYINGSENADQEKVKKYEGTVIPQYFDDYEDVSETKIIEKEVPSISMDAQSITPKPEKYREPKTFYEDFKIDDKLEPFPEDSPTTIPYDYETFSIPDKESVTPSTRTSNLPPLKNQFQVFGFRYPPRPEEVYPFKKSPKPYANMAFETCPKKETGQFVFQWSCSQYLNCWKGRGHIQNCSPGTLFSPETLECEHPEKVRCISGEHIQQVRVEKYTYDESNCKSNSSHLYPHPEDCTKFLNCDNGKLVVQDCAPGTVFNPILSTCDHPYNTNCESKINEIDLGLGVGHYLGDNFQHDNGFKAAERGYRRTNIYNLRHDQNNCGQNGCQVPIYQGTREQHSLNGKHFENNYDQNNNCTHNECQFISNTNQNKHENRNYDAGPNKVGVRQHGIIIDAMLHHSVNPNPTQQATLFQQGNVASYHLATGKPVQGFYITAPSANNQMNCGPQGCSRRTSSDCKPGDPNCLQRPVNSAVIHSENRSPQVNCTQQGCSRGSRCKLGEPGCYGWLDNTENVHTGSDSSQVNCTSQGCSRQTRCKLGDPGCYGWLDNTGSVHTGSDSSQVERKLTDNCKTGDPGCFGWKDTNQHIQSGNQNKFIVPSSQQANCGQQGCSKNHGSQQQQQYHQQQDYYQSSSNTRNYGWQIPTTQGQQSRVYQNRDEDSARGRHHTTTYSQGRQQNLYENKDNIEGGGYNWGGHGGTVQSTRTFSNQNLNEKKVDDDHLKDCIEEDQVPSASIRSQTIVSADGKCPSGYKGLLPHSTDCSKYLNCEGGRTYVQNCARGTVFNRKINACDWPANVNCPSYGQGQRQGQLAQYTQINADSNYKTAKKICNKTKIVNPNSGRNHYHNHYHGTQNSHGNINHPRGHNAPLHGYHGQPHGYFGKAYQHSHGYYHHTGNYHNHPHHRHGHHNHHPHPHGKHNHHPHPHGHHNHHHHYGHQNHRRGHRNHFHYHNPHYSRHGQRCISDQNILNIPNFQNISYIPILPVSNISNWQNTDSNTTWLGTANSNKTTTFTQDKPTLPAGGRNSPHVPVYESNFEEITEKPVIPVPTRFPPRTTSTSSNIWPPPFPSTDTTADYDFGKESASSDTKVRFLPRARSGSICEENEFECSVRECIPAHWVCDGNRDCANGLDEANCTVYLKHFTYVPNSRLFKHEIEKWLDLDLSKCAQMCTISKTFSCKSFNYRREDKVCLLCDTNVGLSGALMPSPQYDYYEWNDFSVNCTGKYICSNKKCINHNQVCDGNDDCGDRQDEKNCSAESLKYGIRLRGSPNPNEGRIEIKVFDEWGYICDDQFGLRDADVACKELGYPLGALEIRPKSYFARDITNKDIFYLMDEVACLGNETSLRDCDFSGWGVHNCMLEEIVGIICKTPQESCPKDHWKCDTTKECLPLEFVCDGHFDCDDRSDEGSQHCDAPIEIRLVNGTSRNEGRVEIKYHGIWGTICDDDFNDLSAKVICRSIGFYGDAYGKKDGSFGPGTGPIWLDQVKCNGSESFIQDCLHWHWGEHNCDHNEDAGVVCSTFDVSELEKKPKKVESVSVYEEHPIRCGYRNDDLLLHPGSNVSARVVQGSIAKIGEYPWQATIRIKGKTKSSHWCGAVVITKNFVLTAAHCLVGFSKGAYYIQAGDYDVDNPEGTETEAFIEDFFIHERFRQGGHMNNDIALVKLKGNGLKFSKHVQPICLPESDAKYAEGLNCTISGFGSTQTGKSASSKVLRAGWIPIIDQNICKLPNVYGDAITEGMICAGSLDEGIDSCDGDSGGPLACLDKGLFTLYGITSWGQHCGYANKPGVYVKVSHYRDWIDKKIKENTF